MNTAAPTIRALELENQKLRADVAELVDTLRETRNELSWCGSQLLQLKRGRKGDCVDQVLDRAAAVLAKHGA